MKSKKIIRTRHLNRITSILENMWQQGYKHGKEEERERISGLYEDYSAGNIDLADFEDRLTPTGNQPIR